ncbi:MAG: tyrosine recombinase XerD [Firmicutes bacterium]|nr:tyrosine recombinase XerD [Bacillota bacterium]
MYIEKYLSYLKNEKRMAANSLEAYGRDIRDFEQFIQSRGTGSVLDATSTDVVAYLNKLKTAGRSPSTVNRKLASVRSFYNYMQGENLISDNPARGIKTPRIEKKELEYLSIKEIDQLLDSPDDSLKGRRDRAILEVLYATGIKVSELIDANVEDINFRMGFITCYGESSKTRIIPMGRPARAALEDYVYEVRDQLLEDNKDEKALFVNYYGKRLTRQGLWKILREYGEKSGIKHKLTPNTLRNSFAVHMLQNGADLKSLQELMGHEDIMATQVYLAATKNHIKDVYDKTHPRAK